MRCTAGRRAFRVDGALVQRQQRIARRAVRGGGVGPALQRWRRRAEHDRDAAFARAKDGDVARRVAHAVLLLERGVVLLVDDDQAEVGQGVKTARRVPSTMRAAVERRPPVARCAPPRSVRCAG
jgi:hypothetical protein